MTAKTKSQDYNPTWKLCLMYSRKRAQMTDCFGMLEVAFEKALRLSKDQFVGANAYGYKISSDKRDFPTQSVYQVSQTGDVFFRPYAFLGNFRDPIS